MTWRTSGSTAERTAGGEVASDAEAAGRTVRASGDDGRHLVETGVSAGDAVLEPSALDAS